MNWLKHAFAIEPPGPAEPSTLQRAVVEKACSEIVRRRMSTPAILFLETFRPLNYLGSQVLHFLQPIVSTVLETDGYRHFTEFLQKRGSIEYLCSRIDQLEEVYSRQSTSTSKSRINES